MIITKYEARKIANENEIGRDYSASLLFHRIFDEIRDAAETGADLITTDFDDVLPYDYVIEILGKYGFYNISEVVGREGMYKIEW